MAVDMFMNMGDKIKGESQDAAQSKANDMDVLAWSWGLSQSGTTHMGSGGGGGKVNVQDLSFTKYIDSASPAIAQACCLGTHIPKCVLLVRKAGGKQQKYLEITMEEVIVASVGHGGSGGQDRLTENVALNFGKVTYEYFKQDKDGATKSAGVLKYDISKNAEV
jgi:type VI secretion system secreted protein Hcp